MFLRHNASASLPVQSGRLLALADATMTTTLYLPPAGLHDLDPISQHALLFGNLAGFLRGFRRCSCRRRILPVYPTTAPRGGYCLVVPNLVEGLRAPIGRFTNACVEAAATAGRRRFELLRLGLGRGVGLNSSRRLVDSSRGTRRISEPRCTCSVGVGNLRVGGGGGEGREEPCAVSPRASHSSHAVHKLFKADLQRAIGVAGAGAPVQRLTNRGVEGGEGQP